MAAPDHVLVDVPADPLGRRDAAGVAAALENPLCRNHPLSPYFSCFAGVVENRPADRASSKPADGQGSMTGLPEKMTGTPNVERMERWTVYWTYCGSPRCDRAG